MRYLTVMVVILLIAGISSVASADIFSEDFESYADGSALHGQGGWKGWNNTSGAGAPVSSSYAYSGSNSVEAVGSADLVHEFDLTGGMWEFSIMQYIPDGTSGESWFILLNTYSDNGAQDWSVQLDFNLGTGAITSNYDGGTLANIVYDKWIEIKCVIDLDNNTVDEYYNGEFISTHQWDDNNHNTLGCIDLYGNGASSIYYDDILILPPTIAYSPVPSDGATHRDTWANLSWSAGGFSVSHDLYFGDNFDEVDTGAESAFMGNQLLTNFIVGFPGFPFPDGLVPGTTYYWRIDEINDLHPESPWAGDVWSFLVPPWTAYAPVPADGAKFVDPEGVLSWSGGFGTKLHTVYFGDNFDDVNNAAGGLPQADTTYSLEALELEKTYYWRVDEFDAVNTYKGEVWSFMTGGASGGVKGDYYSGMNFGSLVLSRTDPQINFSWGDGEPDPAVGADNFSCRWTGEVEAAFTETYTFYTNSDDGVRLWVDNKQLVDNWTDHSSTENRGTIDLVAGNTYRVVMEYYENGGGAVAQLRWSSARTPKQLIPQAALSLPLKAAGAMPTNNAINVKQTTVLTWSPGEAAVSHHVYFGTDAEAVKNADSSSTQYKGSSDLGSESFAPGKLDWNTTYYWRIDEVEDGGTIQKGNVWSFTTADFLVVEDFEYYNGLNEDDPASNRIYNAWVDGYNDPTNGSQVGHLDAPFYEQTIVHSGRKSMPFTYDNAVGKSEATLTLTYPRDWTEKGVDTLVIWYIGDAANAAETMYVVLNGTAGIDNPNPDAAQVAAWTEWNIDLQAFADQGVNLANVTSITLGIGNRANPVAGGSGMMYFDDIRLYAPAP